jgi:signal transduction histidine kinase
MRIRTRLLVVVFGVWISAAAGFGLLTWNLHTQKTAADQRQVKDFADGLNMLVERELDKRVVLARTLASSKAAREGDLARFHDEATVATQGMDDWALMLEPGVQRANTRVPFSPTPVPRLHPRPLTEADPAVMYVPYGAVAKKSVVTVVVPVPGVSPQRFNVGVAFEPASIQRLLASGNAPEATLITVLDDQHRVMARSRQAERYVGRSASAAFKARLIEDGAGFAEATTLDGVPALTYLTPPNAYGWAVVAALPHAQLDAAAWAASASAMGPSGVLLALLLGSALYGARVISRSVESLSRAAVDLGSNQVPHKLDSGVQEFDEVAAALHDAGMKAHDATATLERRVDEAVRAEAAAQAKLLQGQKLELVGRLTAGVAHDFNNLLQTITTAHHVLSRHLSDEAQQRTLSAAVRATSKGADLVKQLMMLGRAQVLEPTAIHIGDAVLKGHGLTSRAVGAGVLLSADIEPGLPPVFVDAAQFDMALLNLVFNARDALQAGGCITIRARLATPAECRALRAGEFVCVEVADDGEGMSSDTLARAVEPFFTTKPVGAGSGLGLAQVHAFTRQSGGDIKLASEPGSGTCVTLILPAATATIQPAAAADVADQAREPCHSLRLLMVEDDALVASVVASALRASGHHVHVCHSADEAVEELLKDASFDVLFTDVVMPGAMNGIDLVNWASVRRANLAAVVATGYADNVSALNVPVIRKPYDIETLQRVLGSASRGERAA